MSFDPYQAPEHLDEPPETGEGRPGVALGLGIFGLIAWIIPIIGLPVTITGLVLGKKAMSGPKKGLALASVILCGIGLAFSAINMAAGAYLGAVGQHPLVNQRKPGQPNR